MICTIPQDGSPLSKNGCVTTPAGGSGAASTGCPPRVCSCSRRWCRRRAWPLNGDRPPRRAPSAPCCCARTQAVTCWYRFDGWYTAANGGTEITTSTTFSADTTVYAHWTYVAKDDQPDTFYTITVTAGKGGTISPSGSVHVQKGGSLTLTITPDKGYVVSSVKIDGKSVGAVKSYTLTNVMGSHAITATFRKAGSPVSGDSGGLPLWNALLCASAFGLACAVFPRRKRRLG